MRITSIQSIAWLLTLPLLAGCGRVVFTPRGPTTAAAVMSVEQQQLIAQQTQQFQEFQQRAGRLDADNQELEALLAQTRQQSKLLEDQLAATQEQLRGSTDQLAALQSDNEQLRNRTTALAASVQRQAGAEIRANNSLISNLSITNLAGVEVRQDGDVIRVALPADELFYPGTTQLKPGADALIRSVGADLLRNYPQQMIGIEAHTDPSPPISPQFRSAHHLSVSWAMSVYDYLTSALGAPPAQLFVIGHGPNHPLVSNATEPGRARNRRVEIVVYPETVRR